MSAGKIYGINAREGLDKAVLFLAFVAGVGGTIALKLIDVPVLMIALFPVIVLTAYASACLLLKDIGTEPETIGDNCYYLGFLFTLASLSITLYRIKGITAEDVDLIPAVISGFGVALSSTIAGVFLRVFLLQLRPDIVVRDRAVRRDLAAGARDLRESVTQASRVLKNISVETEQHVAERNSKMSEFFNLHAEETLKLMERHSESYNQTIKEFGRKLTEEVTSVMREETKSSIEEISKAAAAFSKNLETIGRSHAEVDGRLQSSLEGFRNAVDAIMHTTVEHRKITEGSYRTLAARSTKISQSLQEATETVDMAVAQSRRVVNEAEKASQAARDSARSEEENIRRQAKGVESALKDLEVALNHRTAQVARTPLVEPIAAESTNVTASATQDERVPVNTEAAPSGPQMAES